MRSGSLRGASRPRVRGGGGGWVWGRWCGGGFAEGTQGEPAEGGQGERGPEGRTPQQPLRLPAPADSRLAAVCSILHDDPADPRPLAALGAAAGAGAGEHTLSRLFLRSFGYTPGTHNRRP
ncbi:hypothetical protein [Streptomyces triculaminicus]|uniref:hypothetical protein n=1 Tax=Streptomyces triculaminicus TaxID=2816232 RepID=UPI00379FE137